MILKVHVPGASSYDIGEEIWQQSLDQAIADEAQTIAVHAGAELRESPEPEHREQLRQEVAAEMTRVLARVGDSYRAPDGVAYSLVEEDADDARAARERGERATGRQRSRPVRGATARVARLATRDRALE